MKVIGRLFALVSTWQWRRQLSVSREAMAYSPDIDQGLHFSLGYVHKVSFVTCLREEFSWSSKGWPNPEWADSASFWVLTSRCHRHCCVGRSRTSCDKIKQNKKWNKTTLYGSRRRSTPFTVYPTSLQSETLRYKLAEKLYLSQGFACILQQNKISCFTVVLAWFILFYFIAIVPFSTNSKLHTDWWQVWCHKSVHNNCFLYSECYKMTTL